MNFKVRRSTRNYLLLLLSFIIIISYRSAIQNSTDGFTKNHVNPELGNQGRVVVEKSFRQLTIATYVCNEGAYLAEWVEFHFLNGVDEVIVYDHGSTDITEKVVRALDRHNKGKITFIQVEEMFHLGCAPAGFGNVCKEIVQSDAIKRTQKYSRWLAFLEVSEFMWPVQPGTLITDILASKYKNVDVLKFTATIWGSNDVAVKVRADPTNHYYPLVIGTYFKRADPSSQSLGSTQSSKHVFLLNPSKLRDDYVVSQRCEAECLNQDIKSLAEDLRINSYKYKSREEAVKKDSSLLLDDIGELSMNLVPDETIFYQLPNLIYRLESIQLLEPIYGNVEELYDRDTLFKMHDAKTMDSSLEKPQICAAFLSCKRYPLLKRAISAFVRYMHDFEPNVTYEIAVWDNGGGPDITENILKDFPIDTIVLSSRNVGLAKSLNGLFFGLCKSPYILSLEEDWEARIESWPKSMPIIQMAMDILEFDEKVLEVWVRDFGWEWDIHQNRDPWSLTPRNEQFKEFFTNGQAQYRRQFASEPGWGAYSNGASLKHKDRLFSIGNFESANGEGIMARKVKEAGFASAHICNIQSSDINLNNRCTATEGSGQMLFRHIGHVKSSPGHADYNGLA